MQTPGLRQWLRVCFVEFSQKWPIPGLSLCENLSVSLAWCSSCARAHPCPSTLPPPVQTNFRLPFLASSPIFLTLPPLLLLWKAESTGKLAHPKSTPQPMTDERWCINTSVPSALGGRTQEYVFYGVLLSPMGKIPFFPLWKLVWYYTFYWFSWPSSNLLSLFHPSCQCFLHLLNNYCAKVLILGSASGRNHVKTYGKASPFPCFSALFHTPLALTG